MRRGDKTPDDLDRPPGNSLVENYEKHDVGEQEFIDRCADMGLEVSEWGIDRRHDDGEDGIIYDDKMDFKVFDQVAVGIGQPSHELVALVDVKTKSNPRYMGRFNLRHYEKYRSHAEEHDVPAFVVMFQVSGDEIVDEFVFHIKADEWNVYASDEHDAVPQFPDGNNAALVPHWERHDWGRFASSVKQQSGFDVEPDSTIGGDIE